MIKTITFLLISFLIIAKSGWDYSECNIRTAKQALAPKLWFEQAIDGSSQNTLVTRFYHNKISMITAEIAHCYFERLSPNFFFEISGIFGTFSIIYLLYWLTVRRRLIYLSCLLLAPAIPVLSYNLPTSGLTVALLAFLYKGLAAAGLGLFLFKK